MARKIWYPAGRSPSKREKRVTAKSLRGYFAEARSRSKQPRKVSYGIYGTRTTTQRISKGHAQSIYFNQLKKIMKTGRWK